MYFIHFYCCHSVSYKQKHNTYTSNQIRQYILLYNYGETNLQNRRMSRFSQYFLKGFTLLLYLDSVFYEAIIFLICIKFSKIIGTFSPDRGFCLTQFPQQVFSGSWFFVGGLKIISRQMFLPVSLDPNVMISIF